MKLFATALVAMGILTGPTQADAGRADADLMILGPIGRNMGEASQKILDVTNKGKKEVNIIIDSPGGSVYAGWFFIRNMQKIQAVGVTINCYVDGMAASMAYQILAFCNNRYATPHSMLLWHPVRVGGLRGLTPRQAITVANDLRRIEIQLAGELRRRFQCDKRFFWRHYHAETLHIAQQLVKHTDFFKMVKLPPYVKGTTKKAVGSNSPFGRLLYMHPLAYEMWLGGK